MKKLTSVRTLILKRKMKHIIAAEMAALLALCFAVVGVNINYTHAQAAERSAAGFYHASTEAVQQAEPQLTEQGAVSIEEKAKADAAKARAEYIASVVQFAEQWQGYNYVLGGREMSKVRGHGLDCAGFVNYVFTNGPSHYSWQGMNVHALYREIGGTVVSVDAMEPGDIIFFGDRQHIGIYAGNGKLIHAMDAQHGICEIDLFQADGKTTYSGKRIYEVRRVI